MKKKKKKEKEGREGCLHGEKMREMKKKKGEGRIGRDENKGKEKMEEEKKKKRRKKKKWRGRVFWPCEWDEGGIRWAKRENEKEKGYWIKTFF